MAKLTDRQLMHLKTLDKGPFEFSDSSVANFFDRATAQGYSLDTTGFLAHPGFFQAPHRKTLEGVDIAMLGSPLDLGAIGLAGARHGPEALRRASRNYGPVHEQSGDIPFDMCSIIDWGDVEWSATSLDQRIEDIYLAVLQIASSGCATLNCGGEHTTSYGCLKALSEIHSDSFGLIHIDAHCDTMSTWGGDAINDGSVFRQAALQGFIDPERTVQIGIRGRASFLWEFSHDSGMTVITADEVHEKGTAWVADKITEIIGTTKKTYFSLDVDSLDNSVMMGTTGPEPFGLSPRQVRSFIQSARQCNVIGADLVELNPNRDTDGANAWTAAALFFELLCLLAHTRSARRKTEVTQWSNPIR
jgi:agmatinase